MKYILISLLSIFLFSCEKWDDYYKEQDVTPKLLLYKNNVLYNDTIDSIKVNTSLLITCKVLHRENLQVSINSTNTKDSISLKNDTIRVKGISEGICSIECQVKDSYSKIDSKQLKFCIFKNLPPVASFSYAMIKNLTKYEVEIDASKSFDRDARFGGKIINYDFTLDNAVNMVTKTAVIHFPFNASGTKQVKLRVQDNDGTWSEYITQNISVQKK